MLRSQADAVAPIGVSIKPVDWRAMMRDGASRARVRQDLTGFDQQVKIEHDGPHLDIWNLADMHFGSCYTDYDLYCSDLEFAIKQPNFKIAITGDSIDNFHLSKLMAPMLSQVFSPAEQKIVMLNILDELIKADKLLLFVLGNHEGFDLKSSGESIFQLLDFSGVPIADNRLMTTIKVGACEYRADFVHKANGHSMYNNQHGNIRNLRENSPDADLIVSAHTHSPGFEYVEVYGRPFFMIKTGTYKGSDPHTWSSWPRGQRPYFPIVRLFGDQKKMRHIHGLDELIR